MSYTRYILILLLFSANYCLGQVLEGCIVDSSGVSINGATVYIPELRQGIICNNEGKFRIKIDTGTYTLQCSYPGYKNASYIVNIDDSSSTDVRLVLNKDSLYVPFNQKGRHSQANRIIGKCREKAPYYFNAVKWYEIKTYQSGKLVLDNLNALVNRIINRLSDMDVSNFKDKQALREIIVEGEYFYPDRYKANNITSRGNIPDELIEKEITYMQRGSIYSGRTGAFISPLAPNSSTFYRFRYNGYYDSGNKKYHVIQVEPRMKDPELVSGSLYIEDISYAVVFAVINSNHHGVGMQTIITYKEVEEDIHLPVSYYNNALLEAFGTTGKLEYYSSIKYRNISREGDWIAQKDTDEDVADMIFQTKDEAYWEQNRLQPLVLDTAKQIPDSIRFSRKNINLSKLLLGKVILGDYITGSDSSSFSLRYNGVKMIFRDYNYVDGFWLGNRFDLKIRVGDKNSIEAYPYIYYITARNRMLGGTDISYNYNTKRKGRLSLSMGSRTEDFNNLSTTRYQNYFASLIMGENYNFFYQRDFASVSNSIHLNRKIRISTSLGMEKRSGLTNHTDYNLFNRDHIKDNIFPDDRFDRTFYSVGLSYSPRSNYSITEAMDMYTKNITPVFNLEYQEGFSAWQTNNSKYRKLKGGFSHNIQLDYFNWIDYKIESGVFLSKGKNMHFTDYQHFGASDLLLNLNSIFDSFLLLENYELQTNRYWFNLFLNYSGKYLLIKRIPFLQGKPFTENLHIKNLFTPDIKSYVEAGYSISFNRYFGIGVFTSFHNTQLKKVGVRFSLNLRSLSFSGD